MNTRWRSRWIGAAAAAVAATTVIAASPAFAEYPERPIRLIVPYAAGGGTDALARVIAEAVSTSIGQQLVVENNGSAGGNLATQQAASADPDGYTVLMANQGPMVVNPHLFDTVTVDPLTAFDPVTLLARAPLVVAVPTESPYTSFKEIIDDAKARPGELTYGSAGNGSASHIATLLLADQAQLDMVHIPYKGAGPAITDLIGGRLDFMITTLPSVVGFLDGGKARALAVTTKERAESLPDVPTVAESGWPDYAATAWYGFVVPTGTPPEVVEKLRQASIDAINTPEVQERLKGEGATPVGSEPQDFADYMKAESAFWKDLFDRTGIEMN
jgi:tripartite-type tricarboxylate transporter receptor subunit TctC